MSDFTTLLNPYAGEWVIVAPRRAKRPSQVKGTVRICPFCPGNEGKEIELYRVGGEVGDNQWQIRVLPNKFPFVAIHEVIVDTPEHGGGFDTWNEDHILKIFQTYRQRFETHQEKGQVYIFHNSGIQAGESIIHPHTQLAVIPNDVTPQIPKIAYLDAEETMDTEQFQIFCPKTSQWPDEVWVKVKRDDTVFGDATDEELKDLSTILKHLVKILDLRHGSDFPYNFYIYPGTNWYLRLIPRKKTIGGFEVGTGIFVNTQDPKETFDFIKMHFKDPNLLNVALQHKADYEVGV